MDESESWQTRYDELRATLQRIGIALGDRSGPAAKREAAAQEFVAAWQRLTQHIKRQPPIAPAPSPGT